MPHNPILLSIDVEDLLKRFPDGRSPNFKSHVPDCMNRFLDLFEEFDVKVTCFVCGDLARSLPNVVRKIEEAGHEIACHSDLHITLDRQTPEKFKIDIENNIKSLRDAGVVGDILGFRAPIFSLTDKTVWVYDVLSELGFKYSSSVLPARNPQFGWPGFGKKIKKVSNIIELPMTVEGFWGVEIPIGGMYFRWLPYWFIKKSIFKRLKDGAYLSFIHPYDIDDSQEFFCHPGISNIAMSSLLYFRRRQTIPRLKKILSYKLPTMTYLEYVRALSI